MKRRAFKEKSGKKGLCYDVQGERNSTRENRVKERKRRLVTILYLSLTGGLIYKKERIFHNGSKGEGGGKSTAHPGNAKRDLRIRKKMKR